jgi:glutathione S-transferase
VTNPLDASQPPAQPNHVWVYGNDHSPWVQAVLLGLHQKKIAHTLVTVPPLSVFLNSGILMPAAKIDDGPWLLDSERILVAIGFSNVDADARRALLVAFGSAAMRRTDDAWSFWYRFSYARDGHPKLRRRLWNQFWRSFSIFCFFTLIRMGRRARPTATPEQLAHGFSFFQERLRPGAEFLGGGAPDTVDLQLFGLVQMCASIPGPSLAVLREDLTLRPLREWVEAMQRCFSDYAHLYSAQAFEPRLPEIGPASALERFFYWFGAALMWIAFPITLPTTLYLAQRVRKKGLVRS